MKIIRNSEPLKFRISLNYEKSYNSLKIPVLYTTIVYVIVLLPDIVPVLPCDVSNLSLII